ncbi:MAG: hypothetical protein LPK00_05385 [Bacillaceae bacterium]|nr:hypothetical protein [Bacillaceae bacterium]
MKDKNNNEHSSMAPTEKEMERLAKEMEQIKKNKTNQERSPKQYENNEENEKE